MYYFIQKAKVLSLLILALDKSKISQVVKILQKYFKFFCLTDNMVSKKMIIVKSD